MDQDGAMVSQNREPPTKVSFLAIALKTHTQTHTHTHQKGYCFWVGCCCHCFSHAMRPLACVTGSTEALRQNSATSAARAAGRLSTKSRSTPNTPNHLGVHEVVVNRTVHHSSRPYPSAKSSSAANKILVLRAAFRHRVQGRGCRCRQQGVKAMPQHVVLG